MWDVQKQESQEHQPTMGRSSGGSEVVMLDDRIMEAAARSQPAVTNLSVTKSSRVHIGPKFVSVTQNVDNTEVVKDLPLCRYLWDVAKNTTTAERVSCGAANLVLVICIFLIVYFTVIVKESNQIPDDVAPHEWFITRNMWLAPPFNTTDRTTLFEPLRLVIVAHTVSSECHRFDNCAAEMRNLQAYFIREHHYDLPYSFVIANDGRVYESRGWNVVGAHTFGYNSCSMGLAFVGDYREGLPSFSRVTPLQLQRAKMLFAQGIRLGYLHPDFQVVGAKDLQVSESPGTNLYNAIRQWSNYAHDNVFKGRTCLQIKALFDNENSTTTSTNTGD